MKRRLSSLQCLGKRHSVVQALNLNRKNISCHSANIVAENGYKSNFDYYPCRHALGPTNHFPSPLMGEDKEPVLSLSKDEADNWAGRSRAIGLPLNFPLPRREFPLHLMERVRVRLR